jgi:leader peptidase (prepilin peptidase)/N-methyltransferase
MSASLATAVVTWTVIGAAGGTVAGVGTRRLLQASNRPRYRLLAVPVSAGTSVCFGLLALRFDGNELVAFSLLAAVGVAVSAVDLLEQRIPSRVVLPAYVGLAGLLVIAATQRANGDDLARAFTASALLAVSYLLIALSSRGQLGAGDVKFGGLIGLAMGWQGWATVLAGTFTAWMGAAAYLLILRLLGSTRGAVPMAPFLVGGTVLALTLT